MMQSLARLASVIALILVVTARAYASGPFVLPVDSGFVQLYGGAIRADHYYNTAGSLRPYDSVKTDLSVVVFGVTADFGVLDGLEVNLDVPLGIQTLTSKALFPDRRIVAPMYYGIGGTYRLSAGSLATSLSAMLKIPPGFHRGIYDDPEHPTFLSDGFLQVTTMLNAGFRHKNIWLEGGAGYTWRDEEPLDEIPFALEVGFSRVEGTGIFVGLKGVVSTGDVTEPLRPFYAGSAGSAEERKRDDGGRGFFRTIDRENYLSLGAGAFVDLFKTVTITGRYDLRLFGRNSLALRGATLGVGYRF
ncbi:MAG TPA: hypothetical protein VNA88_02565 [Candidatus Kapabacteria bacterium]|jgi:hypothetical protein|nr:hypothetical protein [Candidatus Kapabacteria bacterium]